MLPPHSPAVGWAAQHARCLCIDLGLSVGKRYGMHVSCHAVVAAGCQVLDLDRAVS